MGSSSFRDIYRHPNTSLNIVLKLTSFASDFGSAKEQNYIGGIHHIISGKIPRYVVAFHFHATVGINNFFRIDCTRRNIDENSSGREDRFGY